MVQDTPGGPRPENSKVGTGAGDIVGVTGKSVSNIAQEDGTRRKSRVDYLEKERKGL